VRVRVRACMHTCVHARVCARAHVLLWGDVWITGWNGKPTYCLAVWSTKSQIDIGESKRRDRYPEER